MNSILDRLRNWRYMKQFVLLSKEEAAEIADLLEGKTDKEEVMSELEKRIEATKRARLDRWMKIGEEGDFLLLNQLAIMESLLRMEEPKNYRVILECTYCGVRGGRGYHAASCPVGKEEKGQ